MNTKLRSALGMVLACGLVPSSAWAVTSSDSDVARLAQINQKHLRSNSDCETDLNGDSYTMTCLNGGTITVRVTNTAPDTSLPATQFGGIVSYHAELSYNNCRMDTDSGLHVLTGTISGDYKEFNGIWSDATCVGLPPRATDPAETGYFGGSATSTLNVDGALRSGTVTYSLSNNLPTATAVVNGVVTTQQGEDTYSTFLNALISAAGTTSTTYSHGDFDAVLDRVEAALSLPHTASTNVGEYYLRAYTAFYVGFDSRGDVWVCSRDALGAPIMNTLARWGSMADARAYVGL